MSQTNARLLLAASTVACASAAYIVITTGVFGKKKKYEIPQDVAASSLQRHVSVAVELALQAGANMVAYCDEKGTEAEANHNLDISFKGKPEDFCTKIDVENERLVTDGILSAFPRDKIIGEETTGTGAIPPLTSSPTWIIDPIDGTSNFAAGLPLNCVSIGYCEGGKPCMGVVYAPSTDEIYIAVKGVGAFRNGVKILKRSNSTPNLREAIVGFEMGYSTGKEDVRKKVEALQAIMDHGCRANRQLGAGVLDLCYVATGRLDVVYSGVAGEGWKPWDYCAGYVIATEAGCSMEAIDQEESVKDYDLYSSSIICAGSKALLEEVRKLITTK